MEVKVVFGGIAFASRGANLYGRGCCVDVSAGSGGGEVYTTGTTVYYVSFRDGGGNFACVRFVGVVTTA